MLIVAPEVFLPLRRASAEFHESTEGLAAVARAMALIGPGQPAAGDAAPPARRPARPGGEPDLSPIPAGCRWSCARCGSRFPDGPSRCSPAPTSPSRRARVVVVVGPNGAGKSTVVSLLLGFFTPSRGAVLAGGEDLRDLDLAAWRRRLAYLPEHPALLGRTLAENLRLANPSAADDELCAALAAAAAPELAGSLPAGLATRLGDGGRPVSAGELQRIALARMLLRPASLYLLDEPTVHLDEASEAAVITGLARALGGRSALVVSHRPAVASLADRVVTLRGGRFVPADAPAFPPRRADVPLPAAVGDGEGAVTPS